MPTITAPAPWDLPAGTTPAIDMLGTYYGVPISDIGEHGDVIALGHVGTYRMAAALRRHAREVWGEPDAFKGATLDEMVDETAHVWMVNTVDDLDEWCLERVESSTPGAFPVTYWTA
ncbi:hypothetical protein [Micromonospora sp. NPDC049891]|uniref:hypothetical protein n=1 Tax=Micromonospora sp. NPDC049891 TaxID=3155655 RepID=UPI00340AF63E